MIIPASALSIADYHNSINAPDIWLSKTTIRQYQEHGPAWWRLCHLTKQIEAPKPGGVEQGLALDCWLTEGETVFRSRYVVKPEGMSFATKEGKAWRADHEGFEIITAEDNAILADAVAAVRALPCWPVIEATCAVQATLRRKSEGALFGIQSRPDFLNLSTGRYFDLKKCRDLDRFGIQAVDTGYCLQAAVAGYCLAGDGIQMETASLIAVEWERGARAREFIIPDEILSYAWAGLQRTCGEIAKRLESGDWSDVQPEPEPLAVPEWMRRKMEAA